VKQSLTVHFKNHVSRHWFLYILTAIALFTAFPMHAYAPTPRPGVDVAMMPPSSLTCPQFGMASWYGAKAQGRFTASGERFNQYAMMAAHRTLPMDTKVAVTNLRNGKSVTVSIKDRGPLLGSRVIDLSHAAAEKLGFAKGGVTPVKVQVVAPAPPDAPVVKPIKPVPAKLLANLPEMKPPAPTTTAQNVHTKAAPKTPQHGVAVAHAQPAATTAKTTTAPAAASVSVQSEHHMASGKSNGR
jgi:rare lipoprotein A (peptidoglycan hydrolase)